jgi:formamidopyrimidine-DNA glycosylase
MPELPDLEVQARNLTTALRNKVVEGFDAVRPKRIHPSVPAIAKALVGSKLRNVERAGKELRLQFSNDQSLGVHLMLRGALVPCNAGETAKYSSATMSFTDGSSLAFTDRQAWITVQLAPETSSVPDALDPEFSLTYFEEQISRSAHTAVKMLLIDQGVVRGIGNAYSDEILWHARIDPESRCGALPSEAKKRLHDLIPDVLKKAVVDISKRHPGLTNGEPRDHLAVHDPDKELSPTGEKILTKEVKGKKSYYTDEQRLYE